MAILALLQAGMKPREPRRAVMLGARIRLGTRWADTHIHNISSRGLMAAADDAPEPGSYVEIRRGRHIIIGRAVWRQGRFFGVRTQDKLPIEAIIDEQRLPPATGPQGERRAARRATEADQARQVERSRQFAATFQFVLLAAAGLIAAAVVGNYVFRTLEAPFAAVGSALAPPPPSN